MMRYQNQAFYFVRFYFFCLFLLVFLIAPADASALERIVSLKPNITEILYELGLGDEVVGVTSYCDYPVEAKNKEKVASYIHVDTEKVMLLQPTVVIGSQENSTKKEIQHLQEQGIRVFLFPFDRLHTTLSSIVEISRLLGREKKGQELVVEIKKGLYKIEHDSKQITKNESVIAIVGQRPLVVVGGDNLLNDVLQVLRLENVAAGSRLKYPHYSTEQFIRSNPDIILDMVMGGELEGGNMYRQFSSLSAVKSGHIYRMEVSLLRPSPRIVSGAKMIFKLVYGAK